MKHIKKVISVILSFCILSGHIFAADPYDVNDRYLMKVLHVLGCFDILYETGSTDNFRPDDFVTRAEAVSDVLKLIGQEIIDYDDTKEPTFTDVDAGNDYFDELETAVNSGIIVGYGEDFRPESNITYNELVRMLCVALGYDNAALSLGGYPGGYVQIASQINLNKRVRVTVGDLTRRDYAVVLYNALSAPMMVLAGVNGETEISKEQNLLKEVHNAIKGEGVVTANGYTTLYTPRGTNRDTVRIEDETFYLGETDAASLIGCYVEYFAAEDEGGDYVLLDIWADEERIVQVDSSNIVPERCGMEALYFQPKGTSRVEKYKIAVNADLIYNSQARVFDDVGLITPAVGTVTLSDTDNNDVYDVIIVTEDI